MLHATEQTSSPALDRIELIPISQIVVTGTNPRTTFPEGYINELAASIAAIGVQTPLWVRRRESASNEIYYDLIAGECRLRGSKKAGQSAVPCIIKDVDEKGALELQIIENLNRLDVQPIEEGRGYQRLLKEHGYSIEDLIAKLHKSKSYIYGRIKLADLPKLGQEALVSGLLIPSVALRVARIPGQDLQAKALKCILECSLYQTDRGAAQLIESKFCRELKGAPFDPKDAKLVPDRGACKTCSHRSGNQADLFPDQVKGRADVCTDPKCYEAKCNAGWLKRSEKIRNAGGEVFEEKEAEKIGFRCGYLYPDSPFVRLDLKHPQAPGNTTWRDLLGEHVPALSLIRATDGRIIEMVRKDQAHAVLEKQGIVFGSAESDAERAAGEAEFKQQQRDREIKEEVDKATTTALLGAVENGQVDFRKEGNLLAAIIRAQIADSCFNGYGIASTIAESRGLAKSEDGEETSAQAIVHWLESGRWVISELHAVLLQIVLGIVYGEDFDQLQASVAEIYGVDVAAIDQQTRAKLANPESPQTKASKKKGAKK